MIDRILEFSINNKLVIGLFTVVLIIFGVYSYIHLPVDAVPDITNNQVQVVTTSPSLAPQEVEQFITFPVEMSMANIQNVTETRSISRFGLSVVTIVFKDKMDIHLARQLVKEQIDIAAKQIPEGYGSPEMMPVTSGLGEIYQYVLQPDPGFEDKYDLMELRTIHDWIVKRYLSGIPGIVEISSFGGLLKQYEVSVSPKDLVSLNVTLSEIFEALEKNNQNTGGSYIEKNREAYYIRSEGLIQSVDDINNIMIKLNNGVPVFIGDVAQVKMGSPKRFGAMTKDGKGEVVGGITLMLKGGNTSEVLDLVQERVAQIQSTLPPGLKIQPYLDRSSLIKKTSDTVTNNLLEGGLIVIFVLILLLGSYRSGLIVASVIPLSMLFAFIMMRIFNVTANLMSLGAVDFGLIIDGAVIIVEGIVYRIHSSLNTAPLSQRQMNNHVLKASKSVGRSATFGVFIILIVYIPILAFTGIEGKTFAPMAQTVIFALMGALILSLTYVPVVSSLFLPKKVSVKVTFADRIINGLNRSHYPILRWALGHKILILSLAVVLFVGSIMSFKNLGGVFIPTLEEGDLAAQMVLPPGSSLTQSIATSTLAEQILMEQFPEIISVVSKIGTAEVPTDPMAVEEADIMIVMKPKEDWTSASNRVDLVEKMKTSLAVIPGAAFEFTQPIQLRFNELMTGVKSDIAVKIYGENLNVLDEKAREAAAIIEGIEGAGDVRVEQTTGLPQLVVKINRSQLALYGLSVEDVNLAVRTAFAGESAGIIFEGEKRFELVLRMQEEFRNNVSVLENLRINKPNGDLIQLKQVADVVMQYGPMQISRDDAKRRINIGINVRNRDVESLVAEIDQQLTDNIKLPPGYYITYGGQFENLQAAKRTSAVAVPLALILILIFLYFAFKSVKQALMVFSAIPLAAMGGIWSLWARGMPFSISAGVGFIVLFGIVVLNGIVLISYYNELQADGMHNIYRRVIIGTRRRLRPVFLTASTDILGFLPMALSSAPGAEVQKPLATVVIGGLITSTFLTLVLLPVIYALFTQHWSMKKMKRKLHVIPVFALLLFALPSGAQNGPTEITLEQALEMGVKQNYSLQMAAMKIKAVEASYGEIMTLDAPEASLQYGEINSDAKDYYWDISQSFSFPTVYPAKKKLYNQQISAEEIAYQIELHYFEKSMRVLWSDYSIILQKEVLIHALMDDYQSTVSAQAAALSEGELNGLETDISSFNLSGFRILLLQIAKEKQLVLSEIQTLIGSSASVIPNVGSPVIYQLADTSLAINTPEMVMWSEMMNSETLNRKVLKQEFIPKLKIGYFSQQIDGVRGFSGLVGGVTIPLWWWSSSSKVKVSKVYQQTMQLEKEQALFNATTRYSYLLAQWNRLNEEQKYFAIQADEKAKAAYKSANSGFENGAISAIDYFQIIEQILNVQLNYLDIIQSYNAVVLELNFINISL